GHGPFEFSDINITPSLQGINSCGISGVIENRTGATWTAARFRLTVLDGSGTKSEQYELKFDRLPDDYLSKFVQFCNLGPKGADYPAFQPDSFMIDFLGGTDTAIAERERLQYLGGFPTLQSPFQSSFIAADRKCAIQFGEAAAMDGLERRKR